MVPSKIKRSPKLKFKLSKFLKSPFIITNIAPHAPTAKTKKACRVGNCLAKIEVKPRAIKGNRVKIVAADVGLVKRNE